MRGCITALVIAMKGNIESKVFRKTVILSETQHVNIIAYKLLLARRSHTKVKPIMPRTNNIQVLVDIGNGGTRLV